MSSAGLGKLYSQNQPNLSLPPNVNGRRRGALEVRLATVSDNGIQILGILWKCAKSYPAVEIQFLWWGQSEFLGSKASLNWQQTSSRSSSNYLKYDILTSEDLFKKYLRAAEPIRVQLISARTRSLIGTALLPIPGRIINFQSTAAGVQAVVKTEICTERGFSLGIVALEFSVKFDRVVKSKENKEVMVRNVSKSTNLVPPEDSSKLTVQGISVPLHPQNRQIKTFRSLDNESKTMVLNYLTGKDLYGSEQETLSEICSISPAESMLEALNKFDSAPIAKRVEHLKIVDCARVNIQALKFTKAGLKEIVHKSKLSSLTEARFIVKVKLPAQTSIASKIKFLSGVISEDGVATFNETTSIRICLPPKVEDAAFEFMIYLAFGPAFHQRLSTGKLIYLGSSVIKVEELVKNRFSCHKKCSIRLASDDIILGTLSVRLELGARGLHFGADLLDALLVDKENISITSSSSEGGSQRQLCWDFKPAGRCPFGLPVPTHYHCRPLSCGQDEHGSGDSAPKSMCITTTQSASQQQSSGSQEASRPERDNPKDNAPKAMDTQDVPEEKTKDLLFGMLHFGQLKDTTTLPTGGYFLVVHSFWADDDSSTLTTELRRGCTSFNYLITFPVMPNTRFLERTRNQHMLVELWQKTPEEAEKLVGVTRLPLHQFYIAFRDNQLAEHLSRAKLPVISIDGWSSIGSPLASEFCGQLQAVLAIGTENQIEYLKLSRGLTHTSGDAPTFANRPVVPNMTKEHNSQITSSTQTTEDLPDTLVTPSTAITHHRDYEGYHPINTSNTGKQQSDVANMLSAFIENLAQRLPISSERSTVPCFEQKCTKETEQSPHSQANYPQLRKTSELLENLQKALLQKPSAHLSSGLLTAPSATASSPEAEQSESNYSNVLQGSDEKLFKILIEIEQAVNLPKLNVSKKYGKRNKNKTSSSGQGAAGGNNQRLEFEPSAYVTFEGYNLQQGMPNTVKSHEGIVYTTGVIESCCNPNWHKKFEVRLPVDLMTNNEKRFILKIWRKAVNNNDVAKCRMLPAPMEDAVIGFTAVDLSVFLNGMPCILGWYNIMDFSGRCNGQIKVNIQPLENVTAYKGLDDSTNFQIPLSIDVDCGTIDGGNTSLSRALKRKFTELEEISQRLKARLFDVTGDEGVDPDDEFERDLNTEADEGDDEAWIDPLEDTSGQKRNSQYPHGALTRTTNTSSYTMSSERRIADRSLTGCSDHSTQQTELITPEEQRQLEELLKKHDLDTIINPVIFKNLINPLIMSTSESTPTSNPYANLPENESSAGTSADADMSEESGETCASTTDKVKLISTALQRATISDSNETTTAGRTENSSDVMGEGAEQQHTREAPEGEPMKVNDK